jgi:hypothetical protein
MKTFKTSWYSVQIPEGWEAERDDVCATITASPEVGALQISAARNEEGPATDEDLLEFAEEHVKAGAKLKEVSVGKLSGFYLHYSDDEFYSREWWLRSENTVVLVTYTTELAQRGQEDSVVDQILTTIEVT